MAIMTYVRIYGVCIVHNVLGNTSALWLWGHYVPQILSDFVANRLSLTGFLLLCCTGMYNISKGNEHTLVYVSSCNKVFAVSNYYRSYQTPIYKVRVYFFRLGWINITIQGSNGPYALSMKTPTL